MSGSASRRAVLIIIGAAGTIAAAGLFIRAAPPAADRREVLFVADASRTAGTGFQPWSTEAQNLVDGFEDTSWNPRAASEWILLAINGPARGVPGESEVHALRIHAGHRPEWQVRSWIRVLGGVNRHDLQELARADLEASRESAESPWRRVEFPAARIRYLRIEHLGRPGRASNLFNEIEAYGTGESAPRKPRRVTRDAGGHVLIEGRPSIPLIFAGEAKDLPLAVRAGFDTVLLPRGLTSDTDRLTWMDEAEFAGLRVLAWIPEPQSPAQIGTRLARNMIAAAFDHPALLGYILDESGGKERRAALIHTLDPDHLTFVPADAPDDRLGDRADGIADVLAIEIDPGRPGRLLPYLALIRGAKALAWRDPSEGQETRREIGWLESFFLAPDPPADSPLWRSSAIDNPSERIDVALKEASDEVWLIAANPEDRPSRPRFAFGWADSIEIREVFAPDPLVLRAEKGRPVEIPFSARGVRVLRMRPSGPIGLTHPTALSEGRPLARANPSVLEVTRERLRSLRKHGKAIEAKNLIDAFLARHGDRVPKELIETLDRP